MVSSFLPALPVKQEKAPTKTEGLRLEVSLLTDCSNKATSNPGES